MRPLFKRTLSAAAILLILPAALLLGKWSYAALTLAVTAVSTLEYFNLTLPRGKYLKQRACILTAEVLFYCIAFASYAFGIRLETMALGVLPVLVAFIFIIVDCDENHEFDAGLFFPLVYLAIPAILTLPLVFDSTGAYSGILLLSVFAMCWLNDVGAYIVGMSFGQKPSSRKLAPKLSPKKSLIGVVGGTLFSFLAASAFYFLVPGWKLPLPATLVTAALVSIFGVCGDLFESLIKRRAGVKDSGNAIPGHGGFLDRFDTIFFAVTVVSAYLILFDLV